MLKNPTINITIAALFFSFAYSTAYLGWPEIGFETAGYVSMLSALIAIVLLVRGVIILINYWRKKERYK